MDSTPSLQGRTEQPNQVPTEPEDLPRIDWSQWTISPPSHSCPTTIILVIFDFRNPRFCELLYGYKPSHAKKRIQRYIEINIKSPRWDFTSNSLFLQQK